MLLGALSLALSACGNGEMLDGPDETPGGDHSRITIAVSTPASGGVLVRGAHPRATVAAGADESAVNSLNVFLFRKDGGDTDADYKYYDTYSFDASGLADGGNGSKTCAVDIARELMGSTVKIALSANDKGAMALEKETTTLEDFRTALATATAVDGDKADVLVGGEAAKSFPMSCIVSDAKVLTPLGVDVQATLVRNVARLDIFNHTPNLTITAVRLENVNDKSCLFGADGALSVPAAGLGKVGLQPLMEFSDKLSGGLAYNTPAQDTEESARESNTHRVSYLYEQEVTDEGSSPVVTIEYTLDIAGEKKAGSVEVMFRKTAEPGTFVSVERNTLYRIRLGDGKNIGTGAVKAAFEVMDWIEGEDINADLDPGKDGDQTPDYSTAALGDIMLNDGTLVKADDITEEQKAQAIGVVAFLYKDQDRVGADVRAKLGRDAKGLVLALKNADTEKAAWAVSSKEEIGTPYDKLGEAYANSYDGYSIAQKILTGGKDLESDYVAFGLVQKFRQSRPAPAATTEWYIPTIGEWSDIWSDAGIGGADIQKIKDQMDGESSTFVLPLESTEAVKKALAVVGSSNIDEMGAYLSYLSSSEDSVDGVYIWGFNSMGEAYIFHVSKSETTPLVRCILAF